MVFMNLFYKLTIFALLSFRSFSYDFEKSATLLITEAKNNSISRKISFYEVKNSYFEKKMNLSKLLPTLDLEISQKRDEDQTGVYPSNQRFSSPRTERAWDINLTVPLFDYNDLLNYKISKYQNESSVLNHQVQEKLLSTQAKNLLLGLIVQKFKIQTLNQSLQLFRSYEKKTKKAVQFKGRLQSEVDSISTNIFSLESRVNIEQQLLEESKKSILLFANINSNKLNKILSNKGNHISLSSIEKANSPIIAKKKKTDKKIIQEVKRKSLYYQDLKKQFKIQKYSAKLETADLYPKLDLRVNSSKISSTWSDLSKTNNHEKSIGVYLTIPLINGGANYFARKLKRKKSILAELEHSNRVSNLFSGILTLEKKLEFQKKQISIMKNQISKRKEIINRTKLAFKYKKATIDDLIVHFNSYYESLISYSSAHLQLNTLASQISTLKGI